MIRDVSHVKSKRCIPGQPDMFNHCKPHEYISRPFYDNKSIHGFGPLVPHRRAPKIPKINTNTNVLPGGQVNDINLNDNITGSNKYHKIKGITDKVGGGIIGASGTSAASRYTMQNYNFNDFKTWEAGDEEFAARTSQFSPEFNPEIAEPELPSIGGDIEMQPLNMDAADVLLESDEVNTTSQTMNDLDGWENLDPIDTGVLEAHAGETSAGQTFAEGLGDEEMIDVPLSEYAGSVAAEGIGTEAGVDAAVAGTSLEMAGATLGASIVIGGLIAIAAGGKGHHDIKKPGIHQLEGHDRRVARRVLELKLENAIYDKNDQKTIDGYKKAIGQLRSGGPVYVVTMQNKVNGKYPTVITHKLSEYGFANAIVTVQQNPNAYKGVDPNILAAMGLNSNLTNGWDGKSPIIADNHNVDSGTYEKAKEQLNTYTDILKAQEVLKNNIKTLDTLNGDDRTAFESKLKQYCYDNNISYPDGKPLTPDQISNKGDRPSDFTNNVKGSEILAKAARYQMEIKEWYSGKPIPKNPLSKAEIDYLKKLGYDPHDPIKFSIAQLKNRLTYEENLKKADTMTGDSRLYYLQKLKQYAYDHNLDTNGNSLPAGTKSTGNRPSDIPPEIEKEYEQQMEQFRNYQNNQNIDSLVRQKRSAISNNNMSQADEIQRQINNMRHQQVAPVRRRNTN
jgi:hypothetical protein